MNTAEDMKRAYEQAQVQLQSIIDMVGALNTEEEAELEQAKQWIYEDPLSIQVRSDWYNAGNSSEIEPAEFMILLCTGGPATRIIGTLGQFNEPVDATLQFQDWFMPWTDYACDTDEAVALVKYAQEFWFGD